MLNNVINYLSINFWSFQRHLAVRRFSAETEHRENTTNVDAAEVAGVEQEYLRYMATRLGR